MDFLDFNESFYGRPLSLPGPDVLDKRLVLVREGCFEIFLDLVDCAYPCFGHYSTSSVSELFSASWSDAFTYVNAAKSPPGGGSGMSLAN